MEKRGLLVIFVLLISAFFVIGDCPPGHTTGHGVSICGINYTCGVDDGVCPETFGANCTDWANNCNHPDSDCGNSCAAIGGSAGDIYCSSPTPFCCGTGPGTGVCRTCCPGVICNTVFAPAALPGAAYNSGGDYSCQANCSAVPACNVAGNCINCSLQNNWYNTTDPPTLQWIDSTTNICQEQLQVWREYRDFTASGSTCTYSVTGAPRWENVTGGIRNKADYTTVCAVETGGCNASDVCISGVCTEVHAPSTTVCRPAVNICDVAENCTGSSATCPLTNLFAPNTKLCNATTACASGLGDNLYNSPGTFHCEGYCDGLSASCDYAGNCFDCGAITCTDSDLANNPFFAGSLTFNGGCTAGACNPSSVTLDYCFGTTARDTTCPGSVFSYQCNLNDTSNCWCNIAASDLNQVCDDWNCGGGRCQDSGSDWTKLLRTCIPALENATQLCPEAGGSTYRCYRTNAGVWTWSVGPWPAELYCDDGYDNDLDGVWDYDTDDRGTGKGSSPMGESSCLVSINSPQVPTSASPGQIFRANITAVARVNSVLAKINETNTQCKFSTWTGASTAVFNCTAPMAAGTYTVLFYVNTSRSYQTPPNRSGTFDVIPTVCSAIGTSGPCTSAGCEWCTQCDLVLGRLSNGNPVDICVDSGTCNRMCDEGVCAADTCDLSAGCQLTCNPVGIANTRTCNTGTCTCELLVTQNCNNMGCTAGTTNCAGEGTATLVETGNNYICLAPPAGTGCTISGTRTCGTYICNNFGDIATCNGVDYHCFSNGTDIVWNQTVPTTELYCDDGYDNEGDGFGDCNDTECSPDNTPYCCNATRCTDTTTPGDDGISSGLNLFDALPIGSNQGTPNCCGNGPAEWYWDIGGGACCDQNSDCIDASGACANNNTPLVEAHQQHCINHTWYPCNDTVHPIEQRGTYYCSYDPSNGGWGWRTSFPPENCTDDWPVGSGIPFDNDNNSLANCADPFCIGNCTYNCPAPENMTAVGTCTDGIDNNCNGLIDAKDFSNCTEGSGSITASPGDRNCNNGGSDEAFPLSDLPDSPLFDSNDDGCCDLCPGMQFDTAFGARTQCGVPGRNCGSLNFSSWETGTIKYCCGDAANEFYRVNPLNASQVACCNDSNHCVDDTGTCQVGEEETEALCSDGLDNDCDRLIDCQDTNCTGTLTGFVTVTDETGRTLSGAVVKSSPPGKSLECERTNTSLSDGSYTLDALIGSYNIIARKPGYDDNITFVTILPKPATQTLNFSLRNGTCHADCADSYYNCNPACAGLSFTNSTGGVDYCNIVSICANRNKGFWATYTNDTTNITTEYTCCEGEITRTYPAKKARVSGNMENLYVYKTIVKLGLKYVTLNIAYWYPCQNC